MYRLRASTAKNNAFFFPYSSDGYTSSSFPLITTPAFVGKKQNDKELVRSFQKKKKKKNVTDIVECQSETLYGFPLSMYERLVTANPGNPDEESIILFECIEIN